MYIIYGTGSELANPTLKNLSIWFDPEILKNMYDLVRFPSRVYYSFRMNYTISAIELIGYIVLSLEIPH